MLFLSIFAVLLTALSICFVLPTIPGVEFHGSFIQACGIALCVYFAFSTIMSLAFQFSVYRWFMLTLNPLFPFSSIYDDPPSGFTRSGLYSYDLDKNLGLYIFLVFVFCLAPPFIITRLMPSILKIDGFLGTFLSGAVLLLVPLITIMLGPLLIDTREQDEKENYR